VTTFRELADALPKAEGTPGLQAGINGIGPPRPRDPAFIEPTLTQRGGSLATAQVVLVAAPAAVGKTMFAEALAADRLSPLWDLGQFAVGSGSFVGKLTESHGISALPGVADQIAGGTYGVVMDALDEGYSLARSDNFEAFVIDLAKQLAVMEAAPGSVVACGRTDTVELVELLLAAADIQPCVFTLDFFDAADARQFIDVHLDQIGHSPHRQYRQPFEAARDALFERVHAAIATDEEGSGIDATAFLGYAPVLIALAGYLRVNNYQTLAADLSHSKPSPNSGMGLWVFLAQIIEDLLEREQPKLVDHLPPSVTDTLSDQHVAHLYSADEQCGRLLARATASPAPTVDLPSDVLPEYERSVNETLGEHPFVGSGPQGFASVVFRDYVLAHALATDQMAAGARALARERAFGPSPLLMRFLSVHADSAPTKVDAQNLDILYSSALAEDLDGGRASLVVDELEEGLAMEIITARGDLVEFDLSDRANRRLILGPRVARAQITAPNWAVILGHPGEEVLVGPDVDIVAEHVHVVASSLRIEARRPEELVSLQVGTVSHETPDFTIAAPQAKRFRVTAETRPAYPWTGFVAPELTTRTDEPSLHDAMRDLKKMLTRFKPGPVSGDGPVLPVSILDVLVSRGRVSAELREYALATGLLTVVGKSYVLHPQQFGINIVDVRERHATPAIREFLAGYVQTQHS
jgi:hypothetical protein